MIQVVFFDTGALGTATRKPGNTEGDACRLWIKGLVEVGVRVIVPEIADYEIRREHLRAQAIESITRLDIFLAATPDRYLPITTEAMRKAAELWAEARNKGYATADPKALDGDVILAAQALTYGLSPSEFLIATDNVGHLARYAPADEWQNITAAQYALGR